MNRSILQMMEDISQLQFDLAKLSHDNIDNDETLDLLLDHIGNLNDLVKDLREKDIKGLER